MKQFYFYWILFLSLLEQQQTSGKKTVDKKDAKFWSNVNLRAEKVPKGYNDIGFDYVNNADVDNIEAKTIEVEGVKLFYLEAGPRGNKTDQILFLLHASNFSSETWAEKGSTITRMSSIGRRVIAIDLPGYGKTKDYKGDKGKFLESAIKKICGQPPILVSPAVSGLYSLPLLERNQDAISGFVAIAPTGTENYPKSFFESIRVPTVIIYGEKYEKMDKKISGNLKYIPKSQIVVIEDSGHAPYLTNPSDWMKILYNFMKNVLEKSHKKPK